MLPAEVGNLYERDGKEKPISGLTGFWNLLPIIGGIVWLFKVQGRLNDFWESKGAQLVAPAPPHHRALSTTEGRPHGAAPRSVRAGCAGRALPGLERRPRQTIGITGWPLSVLYVYASATAVIP